MSLYKQLSEERKNLQASGDLPEWVTTSSWQLLKSKYLLKGETLKDRFYNIANRAASYLPDPVAYEKRFFQLLWSGHLVLSTPILSNFGRGKGCSISCSGQYVGDSVYDFYDRQLETALLSKNGFGTSGYLSDIRPRGTPISGISGGASGVLPVFKDFIQVARDISQGSSRRGAFAGYLNIEHDDYIELANYISKNPDDANVGWIISDRFIERLNNQEPDAIDRYQKALKLKMITGKGYFFFVDKVNRLAPSFYQNNEYKIKASNLCTEIALPSNQDESFSCVLSAVNLSKWKEFDHRTIRDSFIFLHTIAEDFIETNKTTLGLERVVRFTKNHKALGLGTIGFHTYLQDNMIVFGSLEAHLWNISTYKTIWEETEMASRELAKYFGEAAVTKGSGLANSARVAIAPNLSSALIWGGVSQGVEPLYKNAYIQGSAGGELERINSSLLTLMKDRGVFNSHTIKKIIENKGSVQWVDWLNDFEKQVFLTAFEINQSDILRLASARQPYIDQAQSINLFFSSNESEEYISQIHKEAFLNPYIKSLYYLRSESGVQTNKGECVACAS